MLLEERMLQQLAGSPPVTGILQAGGVADRLESTACHSEVLHPLMRHVDGHVVAAWAVALSNE